MRIFLNFVFGLSCFATSLLAQNPFLTTSNLPIMVIETGGQTIVDEPKINAEMRLVFNGPGERNALAGPFNAYNGKIGIELRGSSSQDVYAKKGYSIELRTAAGEDTAVALLGMPKEADWVLLGPYNDKSLMRDALALYLAGQIMDYAPKAMMIELVLNSNYQGVYALVERIKRDKNRVNVAKNEADITGGYILKMDKYTGAFNDGWQSAYPPTGALFQKTDILYHYPKPEDMTNQQKTYIRNWIDDFEDKLASPDWRDPIKGYLPYVKRSTFVDYLLINEAVRNVDAYRLSTYFFKDRDSIDPRLQMGPVWDFNIAFGLGDYCDGNQIEGWAWDHDVFCPQDYWLVPFWWERFREDSSFMHECAIRWKDLRTNGSLRNTHVNAVIDSLSALLQESQVRNFQRWPVMGTYVWPNAFVGTNYTSEVNYLRTWFLQRMIWMDGEIMELALSSSYDPLQKADPMFYPNPVATNLSTEVVLPFETTVYLTFYDAMGRNMGSQKQKTLRGGKQLLEWRMPDTAGVYFYKMVYLKETWTGKVIRS